MDDDDITYFNGVEIGRTEGYNVPRSYKIPANLVKTGKNIITVRVLDSGGNGGIWGNAGSVNIRMDAEHQIDLSGKWKFKISAMLSNMPAAPVRKEQAPTVLYNAMINPLIPYAVKGAIWYQGESNVGLAHQYRELLPLMINDWRTRWGYNFPFYIVQLASFHELQTEPIESSWAELREAQLITSQTLSNTGLAVLTDIGNAKDIHPKNKQEVGRRLSLLARALTYGEKITYSSPIYKSYQMENGKIRISFDHADGGLKTNDGSTPKGFTIAGVDHKFYWADAKIEGNEIVVSSPHVKFPVAVRYAWADNPLCNVFNGNGLPASPFRTDDWTGITF